MSRQGMDDIIGRVRGLIAAGTAEYTLGTAKYWDADQIEQVLDRHRQDLVRLDYQLAQDFPVHLNFQQHRHFQQLHRDHLYQMGQQVLAIQLALVILER
jgi:hypothetical protein